MRRTMMHGKIHRAVVTDANVEYEGSITLDPDLMEGAGILENEQVHVVDIDNGARFVTYVITGRRGAREVVINGAAARLVTRGDRVIVIAYADMEDAEAQDFEPRVLKLDGLTNDRPAAAASA
ncbi:MAG: aspartate 1-decarboxylase [Actinomycetota bacterium]